MPTFQALAITSLTTLHKGLVTNYGEGGGGRLQNGRGGHVKFYSYEKGGGGVEQVLAMLKGGGGRKSFGVVFTQ